MINNEEILKKAIEKAVKNGYWENVKSNKIFYKTYCVECGHEYYRDDFIILGCVRHFIFSHDFAKAFFGETLLSIDGNGISIFEDEYTHKLKAWQYHLQQMVLEEDPISYLKSFI